MTSLLIVESKAKCHKIETILGKGYRCLASLGHLFELAPGLEAIDVAHDFKPTYQLIPTKTHVLSELRNVARQVDTVYLAADPDREGEMIAKHVMEGLKLPASKFKRITFNEITAKAIKGALTRPREIDENLCSAQEARRVLDRLFGFEWSPLLWQYVAKSLSAGRCQSPALALVCEREAELETFSAQQFYKLMGQLKSKGGAGKKRILEVAHPEKIEERERCLELLTRLLVANFLIQAVTQKARESKPPAPFTTSSMQQEASGRLGMNPKRTMSTAQRLYERGHITYMRTDSTALSDQAKTDLGGFVRGLWGEDYHHSRDYAKKSKNSQEAHEAIRPVKVENAPEKMKFDSIDDARLYELVWKRAVASQMAARRYTEQVATVAALEAGVRFLDFLCTETETTFPGYEVLYERPKGSLTPVKEGDVLELEHLEGDEQDTRPKPRYTEASLIKELEKRGIGRPSTFSTIITTLLERGYVEPCPKAKGHKERHHMEIQGGAAGRERGVVETTLKRPQTSQKGKLQATALGVRVFRFLREHYAAITTDGLTGQLEEQLDRVAAGELDGVAVVRGFYEDYHPKVEALRVAAGGGASGRCVHELGVAGRYTYVRLQTRYGWAWARSLADKERAKSSYVSVYSGLYEEGEGVSIERVQRLFKFPRKISYADGRIVDFCYGKTGFYLRHASGTCSVEGDFSEGGMPSAEVMGAFEAELKEKEASGGASASGSGPLRKLGPYSIWNGRFGLFVAKESTSKSRRKGPTASLPAGCDVAALTEADCEAALEEGKRVKAAKSAKRTRKGKN